jgi:hypothetical protein
MTKIQKTVLLLTFWLSPWGAAKGAIWEDLTSDSPYDEEIFFKALVAIAEDKDDWLNWSALNKFKQDQMNSLGIAN